MRAGANISGHEVMVTVLTPQKQIVSIYVSMQRNGAWELAVVNSRSTLEDIYGRYGTFERGVSRCMHTWPRPNYCDIVPGRPYYIVIPPEYLRTVDGPYRILPGDLQPGLYTAPTLLGDLPHYQCSLGQIQLDFWRIGEYGRYDDPPEEEGWVEHRTSSRFNTRLADPMRAPEPAPDPGPPPVYLPIGATVFVLNYPYFTFGTEEQLAAKIIDSSEVNSSRSRTRIPYWYEVIFSNGHNAIITVSQAVPTKESFNQFCSLHPKNVYVSTVDCGELFRIGDKFLLRDKHLFDKHGNVQLLYSKFQSLFTQ
jgi:hypothetical protein